MQTLLLPTTDYSAPPELNIPSGHVGEAWRRSLSSRASNHGVPIKTVVVWAVLPHLVPHATKNITTLLTYPLGPQHVLREDIHVTWIYRQCHSGAPK